MSRYGPNELREEEKEPGWKRFLRQYRDGMQILLLGAVVLSLIIQDYSTALMLFLLTVLNAALGYISEGKAEASVEALQDMLQVQARLRREGKVTSLEAEGLVPGDVVLIEAGDLVPADGRLIRAATLEIEESALTGESQPVSKELPAIPDDDVALGDRKNMAYMNSLVTRGTGEFLVTGTGVDTEIGRIANLLDEVETEKSPLQQQIDDLVKILAVLAIATMALVILFGLRNGLVIDKLFFLAVTIAVAALPTGLPTIVTTLLSYGTQQMAEAHAIVKRLPSVETLGSTSAICSDKTGTLTVNKMTAKALGYGGALYDISGTGYSDQGHIMRVIGESDEDLEPVLLPMALCSDAVVENEELVGDPTEGALVVLAQKGDVSVRGTRDAYPRLAEVPFDSAYKYMATFHEMEDKAGKPIIRCYVKGAPDVIFSLSEQVRLTGDNITPIDETRGRVDDINERMGQEGLRVLALAQRDIDPADFDPHDDLQTYVQALLLVGIVGIVDPPRPEAKEAIAQAQGAGITVRMITGDHKVTAGAIGDQLGLKGRAITGADLNKMSDEELAQEIEDIGVVGRVAPEHKVRIVQALQSREQITAMTGDGVNDAPALKAADIGIAMGITGTEVSKQAAVMILTDDNFATIVRAIEMGRAIYDNLMKYLRFQLETLMGYIVMFVGAAIFNLAGGAILTPFQILWINFAIDVPLGLGLGMDESAPDLMQRDPRPSDEKIMDRRTFLEYLFIGFFIAAGPIIAAFRVLTREVMPDTNLLGRTMVLVTLGLIHIVVAYSSRSDTKSILDRDSLPSRQFNVKAGISLLLLLVVTEFSFLQDWFDTTSLDAPQWFTALGWSFGVLVVLELVKWVKRRRE